MIPYHIMFPQAFLCLSVQRHTIPEWMRKKTKSNLIQIPTGNYFIFIFQAMRCQYVSGKEEQRNSFQHQPQTLVESHKDGAAAAGMAKEELEIGFEKPRKINRAGWSRDKNLWRLTRNMWDIIISITTCQLLPDSPNAIFISIKQSRLSVIIIRDNLPTPFTLILLNNFSRSNFPTLL